LWPKQGGENTKKKELVRRLRSLVIVMNLLVAGLAFVNLYTLTAKAVTVDVPTEEDFTWELDIEEMEARFLSNFTVSNAGLYDITDLDIVAVARDENGEHILTYSMSGLRIEAGEVRTFDIEAVLPLEDVGVERAVRWLLFDSVFYLDVHVRADFMWHLATFAVDEEIEYPWEAPIWKLYDWVKQQSLADLITGSRALLSGLSSEFDIWEGVNVSFDFDVDLLGEPMLSGHILLVVEEVFEAGLIFSYSDTTGWTQEYVSEVVR